MGRAQPRDIMPNTPSPAQPSDAGSGADATAAIKVVNLHKSYKTDFWKPQQTALQDLSFQVQRRESFGFIGPNGAGKTTTIKILMGLLHATSGQAWLLGKPVSDPKSRARVGFLPERPYFYPHLSAREVLHFYGQLSELDKPTRERAIEGLLERVDLRRFADVPLRKYSKGMLQRVGLCQTLLHDPDLLVLDEPMSGLDPMGRALVRDLILDRRARGNTVFFSSHILHDVETLCDRVGLLVGGELRGCGTIGELISDRIRYTDCVFTGAPDVELPGEDIQNERGLRRVRVSPDEVDALISTVQAAGGQIVQVQPVRQTLEHVLLDQIDASAPVVTSELGVLA